jgi:hypothetical protein
LWQKGFLQVVLKPIHEVMEGRKNWRFELFVFISISFLFFPSLFLTQLLGSEVVPTCKGGRRGVYLISSGKRSLKENFP